MSYRQTLRFKGLVFIHVEKWGRLSTHWSGGLGYLDSSFNPPKMGVATTGIIKLTLLGEIKQCKHMGILRGFLFTKNRSFQKSDPGKRKSRALTQAYYHWVVSGLRNGLESTRVERGTRFPSLSQKTTMDTALSLSSTRRAPAESTWISQRTLMAQKYQYKGWFLKASSLVVSVI